MHGMKEKIILGKPVNDLRLKPMKLAMNSSIHYLAGDSVVLLDRARSIRESINNSTRWRIEL